MINNFKTTGQKYTRTNVIFKERHLLVVFKSIFIALQDITILTLQIKKIMLLVAFQSWRCQCCRSAILPPLCRSGVLSSPWWGSAPLWCAHPPTTLLLGMLLHPSYCSTCSAVRSLPNSLLRDTTFDQYFRFSPDSLKQPAIHPPSLSSPPPPISG